MIFQLGALAATLTITQIWRTNSSGDIDSEAVLSQSRPDKNHRSLLLIWRLCLVIAAFWLIGVFCGTRYIDAVSMMLAATGVLFSISNWIPYALIALEISTRSRAKHANGSQREVESVRTDDTLAILAIHNMSITVPQIIASILIWFATKGLELMGSQFNVAWVFLICSPPALIAAWLLGGK